MDYKVKYSLRSSMERMLLAPAYIVLDSLSEIIKMPIYTRFEKAINPMQGIEKAYDVVMKETEMVIDRAKLINGKNK